MNPIAATILGTMNGSVLSVLIRLWAGHFHRPNRNARGVPINAVATAEETPIISENENASLVCLLESRFETASSSPSSETSYNLCQAIKKGITMAKISTTAGMPSQGLALALMPLPHPRLITIHPSPNPFFAC